MKTLIFVFLLITSTAAFGQNPAFNGFKQSGLLIDSTVYDFNLSQTSQVASDYNYSILHKYDASRYNDLVQHKLSQLLATTLSDFELLQTPRGSFKYYLDRPGAPLYRQLQQPNAYTYNPYNSSHPVEAIFTGFFNQLIRPHRNRIKGTSVFFSE